MKILLAVDGSQFSIAAVNDVASRPWPPDSVVRIVHVAESPGEPVDVDPARIRPPFPPQPYAIEKALGRLEGGKLKVEARVLSGRPKSAILDEAREWGADLVVVGSHGTSGIERFLLGSVSMAVAAHDTLLPRRDARAGDGSRPDCALPGGPPRSRDARGLT